jgi:hypothetical protein
LLCCGLVAVPALAQQDPEDERGKGLWLDQGISKNVTPDRSLEFEIHERFDEGRSHLYEYFFQGGIGFSLRPWLTLIPIYRYQRYRADSSTSFENRLLLNVTETVTLGRWRPNFRTLAEGRFPQNRIVSARLRFRPGIDYTLPFRVTRPPVLVVSNEFFIVPGANSFPSGGHYTQNRIQAGIRLPIDNRVSIRPYFMVQSVNLPTGWRKNDVLGLSLGLKFQ